MSAFRAAALGKGSILIASLALLASSGAFALGLGEARVDSYLNQPLDIRIRLLDASDLELDSLTVGPATPADYQRLGVGSSALALDLDLEIDRSVSPAVIRIRSSRTVSDPIVQLLVDARWSSGRLLREYTLFLDPPTLDIAPPAAPARRPAEEPAPEARPARPMTRTTPPAPSQASAPPPARAVQSRAGGEHQVRAGDTLWSIAQANLPADDITMNQMMIAIVELNPQAFRNGNIHQMLRGSQLDLPDLAEARAVDRARAAATVQAQNRAFNQRLAGDVPVISDAARAASSADEAPTRPDPAPRRDSATAAREPEPEARLELVPAGEDEASSGLDEDGEEVSRLRQQLARTEEELFTARLEAEEFRSRLTDLETLVEDNPGGVGIADADLAGLEQTLRAARLAAAEDADPALREEVTAQLDDFLNRFESAAELQTDDGIETPAADADSMSDATSDAVEESESEPVAEPEPVVTQVGDGNRNWWSGPLVLPLAGLVVLLLLIVGAWILLQRRRREAETPAVRGMSPAERRNEPKVSDAPAPAVQDDPIDRAADALSASPNDLQAHLVLLQALAGEEHTERFSAALEDMFEHVETGAEPPWREALELAGRIVPGHVLVKGSADWMSSEEDSKAAPMDELDEESEVGDLMSRLESEPDEETDDRDWADASEPLETREPRDETLPSLHGDDDDEPVTYEHLEADEESVSSDPDAAVLNPVQDPEKVEAPKDDTAEDVLDDDDRMVMDWTDSSEDAESGAPAEKDDEESDIFAPSDDDVDVKLDLARAYLSWNSTDSAKTLLEEVVKEGNDEQKEQARKLLDDL